MTDAKWDVCVIGAGPAGALAAERIAREGASVLLVDKAEFPRDKVCGGCLGAWGVAALAEAGVELPRLAVPTAPLSRVRVHSHGFHAELPLRRRFAVSRRELDAALVQRAKGAGVTVRTGCRARVGAVEGDRRRVTLRFDETATDETSARLVVVASGLGAPGVSGVATHTRRASRVGVGSVVSAGSSGYEPSCVTMACGRRREGYVGVARLPDGRLDIAAALRPQVVAANGAAAAVAGVLRDNGLPIPTALAGSPWSATPRLTQRPRRLGAERLLLVGDAAGYVEPFTGEGMGWALRGSLELAPIACEAIESWRADVVPRWEKRHRHVLGGAKRRCRVACGMIGGRTVTPAVVAAIASAPWLAAPVLRFIDGPVHRPAAATA